MLHNRESPCDNPFYLWFAIEILGQMTQEMVQQAL